MEAKFARVNMIDFLSDETLEKIQNRTEEARANADKIRHKNTATRGFRDTLHDIVPISGTVMVTYLDGKLVDE